MKGISIECPHGHMYDEFELPRDWPKGAPICPLCCKNWIYSNPKFSYQEKFKQMAKVARALKVHEKKGID